MRTSKSQLQWMKLWILRILFFPIWMWAIRRRRLRQQEPVKVFVHGQEMKQSAFTYEVAKFPQVEIPTADKIEMTFIPDVCRVCKGTKRLETDRSILQWRNKWDENTPYGTCPECWVAPSHWAIQLLDQRGCILDQEEARMVDEDVGIVLYADFNIQTSMTIHKSRALRQNKIIGTNALPGGPVPATYGDIVKISHELTVVYKPDPEPEIETEKPKNPELRRLQLLTANSQAVKDGTYPPNTYVLNDSGDMESLGSEVRVKFHQWYPKAMWIGIGTDGPIGVSYDLDSKLFQDIKEKSNQPHSGCMYGCEVVFILETDELVTMFFGTRSSRRASADIKRVEDYEHVLTSQVMKTKMFSWSAVKVTPVFCAPIPKWQGTELCDLDDKHLWNIIQAVKSGQWVSGRKVIFNPALKKALLAEYDCRDDAGHYTKKKIKKIKKKNKKWEEAEAEKKAKREDSYVSRGSRLNY